jgi:hypothetical protein
VRCRAAPKAVIAAEGRAERPDGNPQSVAVGVVPTDGLVSPAYIVARPYPEVESRYSAYLFRTEAYMNEVNKHSRGIVTDRNRLYWDEFKQMPSPCPPPQEQRLHFILVASVMCHTDTRAPRRLARPTPFDRHG